MGQNEWLREQLAKARKQNQCLKTALRSILDLEHEKDEPLQEALERIHNIVGKVLTCNHGTPFIEDCSMNGGFYFSQYKHLGVKAMTKFKSLYKGIVTVVICLCFTTYTYVI